MRSNRCARLSIVVLLLAILATTPSCDSGGGGGCSLNGGTTLAASAWPRFRRDTANTGRSPIAVVTDPGEPQRLFPSSSESIGPINTTPILGDDRIVLGAGVNVYVFDLQGARIFDDLVTFGAISASPVLGADGTIFVASQDGTLTQFDPTGDAHRSTGVGGPISASPNMGADGTVYVASTGQATGTFSGICPNGKSKFLLSLTPSESSPALIDDPEDLRVRTIIFARDNGEVRSVDLRGRLQWAFFGSATSRISAAVMIDVPAETVYVADQTGRVFAIDLIDGRQRPEFAFRADAPISASLALGHDEGPGSVLYVADESGKVHKLDRATGAPLWDPPFDAGGSIRSSPAVARNGDEDVVVFGADVQGEGCGTDEQGAPLSACAMVYAIRDADGGPQVLWTRTIPSFVATASPSIGAGGTVYIGAQNGVLYEIAG